AESCPRNVFEFEDDTQLGGNGILRVANPLDCMYCSQCTKKAKELNLKGVVEVSPDERTFLFTVESTGVMPAEKIVQMAFDILRNKLGDLETHAAAAAARATGQQQQQQQHAPHGDFR
ncbi:hypothetical protein ETH_00035295, partial [Eimeria tenella]